MWVIAIFAACCAWLLMSWGAVNENATGVERVFEAGNFPVEEVDQVVVARQGQARLVFTRTANGWKQIEPFEVAADGYAVRQLLVAAADLEYSRRIPISELSTETSLEQLGLAPPLATLQFTIGETTEQIDLGRRTVAGRGWMRHGGDGDLMVVQDALHTQGIEEDLRNWRSRNLFTGSDEIDSIEIHNGEVVTRLLRDGQLWTMESPVKTRADEESLQRLTGVLGRVEHGGFVVDMPEDLSKYGLDQPVARLVVQRGQEREALLLGMQAGLVTNDRYAMVEGVPTVVRLDEPTLRALLPEVVSLIQPTATGIRAADVKAIEVVHRDGGSIRLTRELDHWLLQRRISGGEIVSGKAEKAMVDELLNTLTEIRAPEVIVQEFPSNLAYANVTFFGYDGSPLDTVRIAQEVGNGRWAMENGDGVLRIFPITTSLPISIEVWQVRETAP
jgi:hypothetical protein